MALPKIEAVVTADTAQAEAGFRRVSDASDAMAGRVQSASNKSADGMTRVAKSSGRMRMAVQNASFQISDMAVMLEMGIAPSRVMAQQLPQLVAGFGAFGAALGTVIAIGIPLATMLQGNTDAAQGMLGAFGTLQPAILAIGDAMQAVAPMLVTGLEAVINNLDRIIITAGVVAGFFAGKWVAGFIAARLATFSLSAALVALRGALIRTGIGAIVIAVGELVYQFTRLSQAVGGTGIALGMVGNVFKEVWGRIKIFSAAGVDYLTGQFMRMQASFVNAIAKMAAAASDFFHALGEGMQGSGIPMLEDVAGGLMNVSANIMRSSGGLTKEAYTLDAEAGEAIGAAGAGFDAGSAPLESVQAIRDALQGIKDDRLTLPDLLGVGGGKDEEGEGGGGGGKSKQAQALDEELSAQEQRIKEHFDRIRALTQGGLSDKMGAWGDYFSNLVSLTGSSNDKLLRMAKVASAGQALIDAWGAYNKVLNSPEPMPWYARLAAGAQVLAAGIGAVNAIKGVSESGSSASTGGTGGGGNRGQATAPAAAQSPVIYLSAQGDTFSRQTFMETASSLASASGAQLVWGSR